MFEKLINEIKGLSTIDFKDATEKIRKYIDEISEKDFKEIVKQIGTAYSARTAHPFQRNGAPFRFKLSKAQQVD